MARFLLIHGSCHGAWCWQAVLAHLRAAGHAAQAIDLPGHGTDPTPAAKVTLERYAEAIVAAIDAPAVVVGHSMGGFPIARAAELAPDRIDRLAFVCAYAPRPGLSLAEMRRAWPHQPLRAAIRVADDGLTFSFDPALVGDRLYHDCPPGTVAHALEHLTPQPIAPQETPIALGAAYAGVRKHYIICSEDRAIPPDYQAAMCADWPADRVSALPLSHSPFFAAPERLAARLVEIAEAP